MFYAKSYVNRPVFHGVIQKITLAQFFLRHGVYYDNSSDVQFERSEMITGRQKALENDAYPRPNSV